DLESFRFTLALATHAIRPFLTATSPYTPSGVPGCTPQPIRLYCAYKPSQKGAVMTRRQNYFIVWVLLTLVCIISIHSQAYAQQQPTSQSFVISGQIEDRTGKAVANAHVVVRGLVTRTTDSNQAGIFEISNLPTGAYSITVTKAGFQIASVQRIVLDSDKQVSVSL